MSEESRSRSWTDEDLSACEVPPRLWHCSRETWQGDWPEVPDDFDLVFIHGPVGSGKTHLAVALMRERGERDGLEPGCYQKRYSGDRVYGCLFADIQRACESMKPGRDGTAEHFTEAGLLVFDDLGAERLTDFTLDRVSLILRLRYDWMRPTIITTNLKPSEFNATDPRLASRLLSGVVIKREGKDRRLA